jgi:hypothetical protein
MRKILIIVNIVLLLGLGGATGYLFLENRDLNDQIGLTTEEKNRRLVEEISGVFDLPDETPIVAVVTDVDEFKGTYPTFDNAEQGDYLLFYRKNRLNILYRQSEKKVVKTADVVVPIAVELIGSQAAIDAARNNLEDFGNQITITSKVDDSINQAFVFDVDDDQLSEASSIAEQLDLEIGSVLPSSVTPDEITEIVVTVTTNNNPVPAAESEE